MQDAQKKKALKGCGGCLGLIAAVLVVLFIIGAFFGAPEAPAPAAEASQQEADEPAPGLAPEPPTRELPGPFAVNLDEQALIDAAGSPPVGKGDVDEGYGHMFLSEDAPYLHLHFKSTSVVVGWRLVREPGFEAQNEQVLATAKRILGVAIGPQTGPAAVDASISGFKSNPRSPLADVYVVPTGEAGNGYVSIHPKAAPYTPRP